MAKKQQEMTEDAPPPPPQPVEQVGKEVAKAQVINWTDRNFALGVNLPSHYPTAVVLLAIEGSKVEPGDIVVLPGVQREVTSVLPDQLGGCAVFLEGPHLNPATAGYPAVASIRRPGLSSGGLPWYGADYHYEPPADDGGGLFGFLGDAAGAVGSGVSGAVNAVGDVAGKAIDVAGAGLDAARNSVLAQGALALATGGFSLVAQAAGELATGADGPVTGTVKKAVQDPGDFLSELPGVVLTSTGLPGVVLDVARVGGSAVEAAFGEDSAVGSVAGQVADTAGGVQQAARDNPVASLEVALGTALLAVGVPGGKNLLTEGLGGILGGGGGPQAPSGEPEVPQAEAPPTTPAQQQASAPAENSTGSSWSFLDVVVALGSLGLVPAYQWARRAAA